MRAQDSLSETFSALADPTRRAILGRLTGGPASVSELAEPFEISLPAISRHLRVLSDAGLISREKDAQWRRCSLSADPLRDAADWIERYRPFWEQSFDRLERHLEKQVKGSQPKAPKKRGTRKSRGEKK